MAAVDKVHNEAKSEAIEEDAIKIVGYWELLLDEGDADNVELTIIQATVVFKQHNCTWTKTKYLDLFNQLGIDTALPKNTMNNFCLMQLDIQRGKTCQN